MEIVLKPKNFEGSFYLYVLISSYTLRDLFKKSPVTFLESEIECVVVDPEKNKPISVLFKTSSLEGQIALINRFEDFNFDNLKKEEYRKRTIFESLKLIIKINSTKYSPLLWGGLLPIVLLFILFEAGGRYNYWFESFNDSISNCDQKCVELAHNVALASLLVGFHTLFVILANSFLFFYVPKKIRKMEVRYSVKAASFLFLLCGIINSVKFANMIVNENTKSAFQIAYFPKEVKNLKRSIASELEKNLNEKWLSKKK